MTITVDFQIAIEAVAWELEAICLENACNVGTPIFVGDFHMQIKYARRCRDFWLKVFGELAAERHRHFRANNDRLTYLRRWAEEAEEIHCAGEAMINELCQDPMQGDPGKIDAIIMPREQRRGRILRQAARNYLSMLDRRAQGQCPLYTLIYDKINQPATRARRMADFIRSEAETIEAHTAYNYILTYMCVPSLNEREAVDPPADPIWELLARQAVDIKE